MSEIKRLKLHQDLYNWHSNQLEQKIQKKRESCQHDMVQKSSKVTLEYDFGFFYKVVTTECSKCSFTMIKNDTGW